MARRMSGGRFKRRSSMKMLHTAQFIAPVNVAAAAGDVLGYLNIYAILSEKYGRSLAQAMTYRVVGLHVGLFNTADVATNVGGSLAVQAQYVAPSRARVAAHEAIMREYVGDVRDDSEQSRGRQLIVGYDAVQTPAAWESVLLRNDAATRIHMLGASSAGNVGIFDDWNLKNPSTGGAAGLYQPDQDLHVPLARASQTPEQVHGRVTMAASFDEDIELLSTDQVNAYGEGQRNPTVHAWDWWAPAGTYLPVMLGMMKFILTDGWFPFLQPGMLSTNGTTVPTRGSFQVVVEAFIEGWTPISKK